MAGGAGKTAVLVYTMPLWAIPLAWWVLGERVRGLQWLAIAGGLAWALFAILAKRVRRAGADQPVIAVAEPAVQSPAGVPSRRAGGRGAPSAPQSCQVRTGN